MPVHCPQRQEAYYIRSHLFSWFILHCSALSYVFSNIIAHGVVWFYEMFQLVSIKSKMFTPN